MNSLIQKFRSSQFFPQIICRNLINIIHYLKFVFITTSINETILDLSQKIMKNPLRICENKRLSLNNIKQFYIQLETNDYKFDTLIDLFEILTKTPVIVFCNTKKVVKQLKEMMENKSLAVSSIVIQNQKKSFTKNFC